MFSSMSSIEILFELSRLPHDERRLLSRRALAVDEIAALEHTAVAGLLFAQKHVPEKCHVLRENPYGNLVFFGNERNRVILAGW